MQTTYRQLESLPSLLAADLERAAAAVARLDGALLGNPLVPAWQFRTTLAAALALAETDGLRPDPNRVAALALGLRQDLSLGPMEAAAAGRDQGASAHALRLFLLLRDGLSLAHGDLPPDADPEVQDVNRALAHLVRSRSDQPALLAAGLGLRHWVEAGGDRPSIWAALPAYLVKRGMLRVPCPLIVGAGSLRGRTDWNRPVPVWLRTFLQCLTREAEQALTLLLSLERTWRQAKGVAIAQSRSNSRLPQAVDLLALAPIINPEGLARFLSGGRDPRGHGRATEEHDGTPYCSPRGAAKILEKLEALGLVVELSDRGTHKVYSLPDLGPLRATANHPRQRRTAGAADTPPTGPASPPIRLEGPPLDEAALDAATAELDAVLSRLEARMKRRTSDVG